jgi:hypothetical protein
VRCAYASTVATLKTRLGEWQLEHLHAWADRRLVIQASPIPVVTATTKAATIGSCFASELARQMADLGIPGGMHPGGLFYSTATIRQELERIAGGWSAREAQEAWRLPDGYVDPFRDYGTVYPDLPALEASRAEIDTAADALFGDADVVVVTLGLIETWRDAATGNTFRQIPHPAVFTSIGAEFHRLTVAEMAADLERIRSVVCDRIGARLVVTTSPVPLHTTFTPLDVRVANVESKSRIRAAVSEFVEQHPEVIYFHSYEMVVTAERQGDYFREDGRHVHRHAVRYILSQFLELFGDGTVSLGEVDASWLTPISQTAPTPAPLPRPARPKPRRSFPRRVARAIRRRVVSLTERVSGASSRP